MLMNIKHAIQYIPEQLLTVAIPLEKLFVVVSLTPVKLHFPST